MDDFYQWQGDDLMVKIRVQPKASKDEICGLYGNALKIRITAPPVDGRANSHLINYLSNVFDVPRSRIEMLSGHSGRDKRVLIHDPRTLPALIPHGPPDTGSTPRNT